jgi:transketolase
MNTLKQSTHNDLKKRILELSYKYKLSHLGSCLTAVDIIDEIYSLKQPEDRFILSSGHAGLALYVVLEKYLDLNAETIWLHHGVHPDRCLECHIDCSSGSLGQGLPIAVGMALADKEHKVYCLISDGECAEGSIWEALRIKKDNGVKNLKIYVNYNGWSAYDYVDLCTLGDRLIAFGLERHNIKHTDVEQYPFLKGNSAHYYTLTKEDYETTI